MSMTLEKGLRDILRELEENIDRYGILKETGNSDGDHKEFFRGKWEAYKRSKVILERQMEWHSIPTKAGLNNQPHE